MQLLEISQYLENYLWPHFDAAAATPAHVMSIILMLNEKFKEQVSAWACFQERQVGLPRDSGRRVEAYCFVQGQGLLF